MFNKITKLFFILVIFLLQYNLSFAKDREAILVELFQDLKNENIVNSDEIEQKIWKVWITHPTNQLLTLKLEEGSRLVKLKQFSKALEIFNEVIERDRNWAEAWNKRATVFYLIGEYKKSQNDIDKVLMLERRHFGALAGQGLVNIELRNYEKAILSYKKAKEIYPSMQSSEIMIRRIEKLIKQQTI